MCPRDRIPCQISESSSETIYSLIHSRGIEQLFRCVPLLGVVASASSRGSVEETGLSLFGVGEWVGGVVVLVG